MRKPKLWIITQQQIAAGDIDSAILQVDPEQLPETAIRRLHGGVRLHVEGARGPQDLFTLPAARKFFRELQQRWPWAGFFLAIAPISQQSTPAAIRDVGTFLALMMCRVDELTYVETAGTIELRFNSQGYSSVLDDILARADQLGEEVDLPAKVITARHNHVCRSLSSFFEAAKEIRGIQ